MHPPADAIVPLSAWSAGPCGFCKGGERRLSQCILGPQLCPRAETPVAVAW